MPLPVLACPITEADLNAALAAAEARLAAMELLFPLKDECGNPTTAATEFLTKRAQNPVGGNVNRGPTRVLNRADLQALGFGPEHILARENGVLSVANPSTCASMAVNLSMGGRSYARFDALNVNNSAARQVVTKLRIFDTSNNSLLMQRQRVEIDHLTGHIDGTLFDANPRIIIPPSGVLSLDRDVTYQNTNDLDPDEVPLQLVYNMPDISVHFEGFIY